jgi:Na+-translocating membrane potential-generating system (MpsC)
LNVADGYNALACRLGWPPSSANYLDRSLRCAGTGPANWTQSSLRLPHIGELNADLGRNTAGREPYWRSSPMGFAGAMTESPMHDHTQAGEVLGAGRLLAEITNRIVALMREHYGRGPIRAKTYVLDNLIVCVLSEGFTAIERLGARLRRARDQRSRRRLTLLIRSVGRCDSTAAVGGQEPSRRLRRRARRRMAAQLRGGTGL